MGKSYTDKFLISELRRFVREKGFVPTILDMQPKYGYPSGVTYHNHFGSWNNALEIAGLEINETHEKRTGNETCYKCGDYKKNQQWHTKGLLKGQVMCYNCYNNSDYKKGNLNKNSPTGKATISQRIVANVLGLELKYDCNCKDGFKAPVDLYDKSKYNYINVKDSKLHFRDGHNSHWDFNLTQEVIPDTYICLGYDENRKHILHVWITDPLDDLVYDEVNEVPKKSLTITNIPKSLKLIELWEVDAKPYDDMLHLMSEKRKDTNGKECFLSNDDLLINSK